MPRRTWGSAIVAASVVSVLFAPMAVRADPPAAITTPHVVQPGETLSQIAVDAGVDTAALAALNGLSDQNAIAAGQTLNLPAPQAAAPRSYTVAQGDTLWDIAQHYRVSTDALIQLNKLDETQPLSIGAEIGRASC